MRILWLVFERLPHPDAISYPAGEEEARLVLRLCGETPERRVQLATQLRRFSREQESRPVFQRRQVAVQGATGLWQPISWRLAKWLGLVLPAADGVLERVRGRVRQWLADQETARVDGRIGA